MPLRDEIVKVFESMDVIDPEAVIRGQYEGYRDEPGVDPASQTETFVALRTEIHNWRWKGVPFYLRTGKCLGQARQVVTIGFSEPPLRIFPLESEVHAQEGNRLVIDFADPGSIHAEFLCKLPGPRMHLGGATMTFNYADSFMSENNLEAYEHLILEAMRGDQALFTRSDGIERLWEVSAPLLEQPPPVEPYACGLMGTRLDRRPRLAEPLVPPGVTTPIRLVLSDVDGTLVTSDKTLTDASVAAVARLRAAGVAFAVTSGRPPRGMAMLVEPLALSTPIAGFNGGLVVDPTMRVLEERSLPQELVPAIIEELDAHGLDVWCYRGVEWLVRDANGVHVAQETATVQFPPRVCAGFDGLAEGMAKVVGVSDDPSAVAAATEAARERFGDGVSASTSQPYYLDVTHPEANKGCVVTYLSAELGIDPSEIATIGDMPNDVLMFARSGLSIAMGNGDREVHRSARHVTRSNDEDGFAYAIDRFVLGE